MIFVAIDTLRVKIMLVTSLAEILSRDSANYKLGPEQTVNAQPGLPLCCSYATKSGFLAI